MNLDKLKEAAERRVGDTSATGYYRDVPATILALITRLTAAEELNSDYEKALKAMTGGSTIRVYGNTYISESGEKRRSVALTGDARRKLASAIALHTAYRKEYPTDE